MREVRRKTQNMAADCPDDVDWPVLAAVTVRPVALEGASLRQANSRHSRRAQEPPNLRFSGLFSFKGAIPVKSKIRFAAIGVLAIAGICLVPAMWNGSGESESAVSERLQFDYPEEWTRMRLPQIPDGRVISQGEGNLQRGFYFDVAVDRSPEGVAEFFEQELHHRWFNFFLADLTDDGRYLNQFSSSDVQITINALPSAGKSDHSNVRISMKTPRPAQAPASFSSVRAD